MVMRDVMDSRSNVREIEKIERRLGSVQSTIGGDGRGETKSEVLGRVEKTVRGGGGGGVVTRSGGGTTRRGKNGGYDSTARGKVSVARQEEVNPPGPTV